MVALAPVLTSQRGCQLVLHFIGHSARNPQASIHPAHGQPPGDQVYRMSLWEHHPHMAPSTPRTSLVLLTGPSPPVFRWGWRGMKLIYTPQNPASCVPRSQFLGFYGVTDTLKPKSDTWGNTNPSSQGNGPYQSLGQPQHAAALRTGI